MGVPHGCSFTTPHKPEPPTSRLPTLPQSGRPRGLSTSKLWKNLGQCRHLLGSWISHVTQARTVAPHVFLSGKAWASVGVPRACGFPTAHEPETPQPTTSLACWLTLLPPVRPLCSASHNPDYSHKDGHFDGPHPASHVKQGPSPSAVTSLRVDCHPSHRDDPRWPTSREWTILHLK